MLSYGAVGRCGGLQEAVWKNVVQYEEPDMSRTETRPFM